MNVLINFLSIMMLGIIFFAYIKDVSFKSLHRLQKLIFQSLVYTQVYYTLNVAGFSGAANDALYSHNGYGFSTFDNDHDGWAGNCAGYYLGAWWYVNFNV